MLRLGPFVAVLLSLVSVNAFPYDPALTDFNLNQNQAATNPVDYWGEWENHQYHPSPSNWRFPYYTVCTLSKKQVL